MAAAPTEEEQIAAAIAASLSDQSATDADEDLRKALEASKNEEAAQVAAAVKASTTPKDLDAMTDQERDAMTIDQLNGLNEEAKLQPMVGARVGVAAALGAEYADNPQKGFATSIARLDGSYASLRRVRKDGNCFYRGFLYRYLEELLVLQLSHAIATGGVCAELARIREVVKASKDKLLAVGYEAVVVEDVWEALVDLLEKLPATTPADLHRRLNDETGDVLSLVWYMRLLTAGAIKADPDRFAPFVMDEAGNADVHAFCAREVEPASVECDQVQIIALTETLGVPVAIEYLDASGAPSRFVCPDGAASPAVTLLYRPGHYDVLYEASAAA